MKRTLLHVLIAAALTAAPALAQGSDTTRVDLRGVGVGEGARVRVTAPAVAPERMVGTLAGLTADTLLLSTGRAVRLAVDSRAVQHLEVSSGHRRLKWGLIGAGAGFFAGAILGGYAGGHAGDSDGTDGLAALAGFVAGSIVGIPIGAGVGALAAPEEWTPVRLPYVAH